MCIRDSYEKSLGSKHLEVGKVSQNLAMILQEQNKMQEAEAFYACLLYTSVFRNACDTKSDGKIATVEFGTHFFVPEHFGNSFCHHGGSLHTSIRKHE